MEEKQKDSRRLREADIELERKLLDVNPINWNMTLHWFHVTNSMIKPLIIQWLSASKNWLGWLFHHFLPKKYSERIRAVALWVALVFFDIHIAYFRYSNIGVLNSLFILLCFSLYCHERFSPNHFDALFFSHIFLSNVQSYIFIDIQSQS